MSEIELHGDENKSKEETDLKNVFFKFNLKVVKTNRYKQKSVTKLSYTS